MGVPAAALPMCCCPGIELGQNVRRGGVRWLSGRDPPGHTGEWASLQTPCCLEPGRSVLESPPWDSEPRRSERVGGASGRPQLHELLFGGTGLPLPLPTVPTSTLPQPLAVDPQICPVCRIFVHVAAGGSGHMGQFPVDGWIWNRGASDGVQPALLGVLRRVALSHERHLRHQAGA